jgi:hypothetical protein
LAPPLQRIHMHYYLVLCSFHFASNSKHFYT